MKMSASVELIWTLAAQEAIAASFKEIEPEHLFIALLKFSDLGDQDLRNGTSGVQLAAQIAAERDALRKAIQDYSVTSTTVRRSIRARLGNGGVRYDGGEIHRSPACRDTFAVAQRIAEHTRHECSNAQHLFEALMEHPTPIIAEFVKGCKAVAPSSYGKSPNLKKYTRDLTELVINCNITQSTRHEAAIKALVEVLVQGDKRCVILVASELDIATVVILSVAQRLTERSVPVQIRKKRILEVVPSRLQSGAHEPSEIAERLDGLFVEAGAAADVILYLPAVGDVLTMETSIVAAISASVRKGTTQCTCAVSDEAFDKYIRPNADVREVSHVIWLRDVSEAEVPWEM